MSIPYVQYGGTQTLQPPYLANDINFYAFLVPASVEALQAILDNRLNTPSGGQVQFEPAGPFVIFAFNNLGKMSSMNPPDRDKGWFSEQECAIWVRVVDRLNGRSMWFLPYIFVGNSYAMVLGREVYGFPKAFGWFQIPNQPTQANELWLETLTLPVFSPDTQGIRKRLLTARRTSDVDNPVETFETAVEAVAQCAGLLAKMPSFIGKVDLILRSVKDLILRVEPLVFLKQFPASDVAGSACYQSIVELTTQWTKLHGVGLLAGDWQIDIAAVASHPIAKDLGLSSNSIQSALSLWVHFDMNVNLGEDLWVADPKVTQHQKIAILGGGVGGMSAALQLTAEPDWKSRYDITVYQMGWRLGGKGASGRGENNRIEEHGLHIWLGFYENAFRIMRQVYSENQVNRAPGTPLREWTDAFKTHNFVAIMDRVASDAGNGWDPWPVHLPSAPGTPGDGLPLTLWDSFLRILGWIKEIFLDSEFHKRGDHPFGYHGSLLILQHSFGHVLLEVLTLSELTLASQLSWALKAAEALDHDPRKHSPLLHEGLAKLLEHFRNSVCEHIRADVEAGVIESRRLFQLIDLGLSICIGLLNGGYLKNPAVLDLIGEELQIWLKNQGAHQISYDIKESAVVRALYDLVFAYENGDADKPSFEAGPALRSILLIAGAFKGSLFWKMQAGMGDVVFAPMYQVLKNRGVNFEFFHRVESLQLSADKSSISAIKMGVQATLKDPSTSYDPLVNCESLPCWPAQPRYEQLVEGGKLKAEAANLESFWTSWNNPSTKTLRAGTDFNQVVLAISLGALPYLFEDVSALPPAFQAMLLKVQTVRTQAIQLWVNQPLDKTGWSMGSVVLDAFGEPINTWASMEQLLDRESWPDNSVQGIHYFCGQMSGGIPARSDMGAPAKALAEVEANCDTFVKEFLPILWPKMNNPDFKIVSRYLRANIDPTERYVLSVAHSTQYRLRANASGIGNMVLAGDWTNNGFNAGCVEAAVMSGIQAANAVAGNPLNQGITGPLSFELLAAAAAP